MTNKMKKLCSTAMIVISVLIWSNKLTAQGTEPKFNQVELMKKFIGSWKIELPEGEAMIMEVKPFGTAMVGNTKFISNDTAFDSNKYLWDMIKQMIKLCLLRFLIIHQI